MMLYRLLFLFIVVCLACFSVNNAQDTGIQVGAERTNLYLDSLLEKKIAVVANHTSYIGKVHLVDTLLSEGIMVKKIFSPEHGFRGKADASELVNDSVDYKTGLPVISLYGKRYKPSKKELSDIDLVVFDIQDVGVRFYTYTSTMHYVMEACAENGIQMIVLDRPNPNAYFIDGPVLEMRYNSFLGKHPVPLVHGMTIGEYALMINQEGWLKNGVRCSLQVITCTNYTHATAYEINIPPSPNLPNTRSVLLYPSLGLFEGTTFNAGRGTLNPFQQYGHPLYADTTYWYIPRPVIGAAKNPKQKNKRCYGVDLSTLCIDSIRAYGQVNLGYIIDAYSKMQDKKHFFNPYFQHHAGNANLQLQIIEGISEKDIRKTWQADLDAFKLIRSRYLLYP